MAKKSTVKPSEPALFSTEQYSSGIGDIERSQSKDPYWDEIVLDSEINQVEPSGQTTLFYDSTDELPEPSQFDSIEVYNAAYDSWRVNHPKLANHGFTEELDRLIPANAEVNTFIVEKTDNALHLGIITNIGNKGFYVDWLNFGESKKGIINFFSGTNFFISWEHDLIERFAIAPTHLIDKFLAINPDFFKKQDIQELIKKNQEIIAEIKSLTNEDRGFKIGDRLLSIDESKKGEVTVQSYPFDGSFNMAKVSGKIIFCNKLFKIGDRLPIISPKKYYSDDNWGIFAGFNPNGSINCKVGDRYWIAVDVNDIGEGEQETPPISINLTAEINKVYLHSIGKKFKVSKVLRGKNKYFVDGYFQGDPILERVAISDLAKIVEIEESKSCSNTPHSLPESVVLNSELKPQEQRELSTPEFLLKTTQKLNESSATDSPKLNSTQTSETGNQHQENSISIQSDSPVQVQALQGMDQDLITQNQVCGLKLSDVLPMAAPVSSSLKILQDLSITDYEQFLGDSEWLDIVGKIRKSYQQRNSAHPMKEKGFSSLPTPTTYPKGSGKYRLAGTNRLEQKLRPFINKGDKLHPAVPGWMMGFPVGWVEQVLADTGEILSIQVPLIPALDTTSTTAATVLTSTDEPLHPNRPVLQLNESVTLLNSQELLTPTNTDKQATIHNKPWYEGKFNLGDQVVWQKYPDLIYEIVKPEKAGHVVIELKSNSESAPSRKRVALIELTLTTPTTATIKIKALTLHQPWASLVGKFKNYETRGKATNYRGKIAIHAAVRQEMTDYQVNELADLLVGENIPFGVVVAIADLTDCIKMTEEFINQQSETELRCGLWEVGRYAWKLENVQFLPEPMPARGMPGLWDIELPIISSQESEGRRQEVNISPQSLVTCQLSPITKPTFKTGEYILNGRVGEIIEDSPGEYFVVKYSLINSNDLKCYFWGQDDEFIDQIVLASPDLVEQFVRENRENTKASQSPKKKTASGSLAPFLENKKLKSGEIITYPRVNGERDKLNYDHWRWGYYYEVKVNGEWRNKSLPLPARIAPLVREMIDKNYPVEEIKSFILQCKNKKGGDKID
jgi:hypothetical protein